MAERCDTDKSIMIRVSKVSVAANVFCLHSSCSPASWDIPGL